MKEKKLLSLFLLVAILVMLLKLSRFLISDISPLENLEISWPKFKINNIPRDL